MAENAEIALRLREQKRGVERLAYTLRLLLPQSASSINDEEHMICAWIDDACEALLGGVGLPGSTP